MNSSLLYKSAADALKFIFNFSATKPLPPTEILVFEHKQSNEYKTEIIIDLYHYCDDGSHDQTEDEKKSRFAEDVKYFLDVLHYIGAFDTHRDSHLDDFTNRFAYIIANEFLYGDNTNIDGCDGIIDYNNEYEINGEESCHSIKILTHLPANDIVALLNQEIPDYARPRVEMISNSI